MYASLFYAKCQVSHITPADFRPGGTILYTPPYVKRILKNNQNRVTESQKLVEYIKEILIENWKTMRNCTFVCTKNIPYGSNLL